MSAELERSYRRALGWYPRNWREKNADVVAGTLLDVADAEHRTRPRRGELANLTASGISTRLGVLLESRARNAISTIALATGVGYLLAYFTFQLWSPSGLAHAPEWMFSDVPGLKPIVNSGLLIAAVWSLALVLALIPRRYGFRPVIGLAILASIALILINRIPGIGAEWYGLTTTSMVFLALLGALVLIGTPARSARLLLCTATALGLTLGAYALTELLVAAAPIDEHAFWSTLSGAVMLLLVLAAFAAIALGVAGRTTVAQTIVISALPWAVQLMRAFGYQDLWNIVALLGIAAALVGFGALLPLVFRRGHSTRVESEMPPS
jgi:hypothetical protein